VPSGAFTHAAVLPTSAGDPRDAELQRLREAVRGHEARIKRIREQTAAKLRKVQACTAEMSRLDDALRTELRTAEQRLEEARRESAASAAAAEETARASASLASELERAQEEASRAREEARAARAEALAAHADARAARAGRARAERARDEQARLPEHDDAGRRSLRQAEPPASVLDAAARCLASLRDERRLRGACADAEADAARHERALRPAARASGRKGLDQGTERETTERETTERETTERETTERETTETRARLRAGRRRARAALRALRAALRAARPQTTGAVPRLLDEVLSRAEGRVLAPLPGDAVDGRSNCAGRADGPPSRRGRAASDRGPDDVFARAGFRAVDTILAAAGDRRGRRRAGGVAPPSRDGAPRRAR
jgi:chromosome segregation ATPase